MNEYSVAYKDQYGVFNTTCYSDGTKFEISLRGEIFVGTSFNLLAPVNGASVEDKFRLEYGVLSNCSFQAQIPIYLLCEEQKIEALLYSTFDYTLANDVTLDLSLAGIRYQSGKKDDIESALISIQQQLPKGVYFSTCLSCKYSHYHPVGNNDIGDLRCFWNVQEYLPTLRDKCSLLRFWDTVIEANKLVQVQEIFLCKHFQLLAKDDWSYKDWNYFTL